MGSELLFDVLGASALTSPYFHSRIDFVTKLGARWTFGSDEPESLLAPLGWDVRAEQLSEVGHRYGRWTLGRWPRNTPGVPQAFLVHAVKR